MSQRTLRTLLPLDRWTLVMMGSATVYQAAVTLVDLLVSWTLFAFYLLPVMAMAWLVRGWWWLVWAFIGSGLWFSVRLAAFPENEPKETLMQSVVQFGTRLLILATIGFLCAKLRSLSRSPMGTATSHDSTGLLSAVGMRDTLERRARNADVQASPVAMVLLDVERRVTAYGGHSTEHSALVGAMLAKALQRHARPGDLCVRLSPNHFLLIMHGADETTANTVHAAMQDEVPEISRSLDGTVTINSLLLFSPEPVTNMTGMRIHAENRLTTLKVVGSGRHHAERWVSPAA